MTNRILLWAVVAASALTWAGCGDQFKRSGGLQGAIDAGVQEQSNTKARRYEDAEVSFERPANWTATPIDTKDDNVYSLDISGPNSFAARLTFLRQSNDPGAFPFEIIQRMRRENPSVEADRYAGTLGGREARGYSYKLKADGIQWEGLVVAFTQARSEACFLGQYPADAGADRRKELTDIMAGLHLKSLARKPDAK